MLRGAITRDEAATQLREFIQARLMQGISPQLRDDHDAVARAGLASSILIGVIVGRRIVRVPALVDEDTESLIARIAPAVQAILTTPNTPTTGPRTNAAEDRNGDDPR